MLYNLESDIGETTDVAGEHPEIVAKLQVLARKARKDIGDENKLGENSRFKASDVQQKRHTRKN